MVTYPLKRGLQSSVFGEALTLAILAGVVMLLRILARIKLGRSLDLSDYIILGSIVCLFLLSTSDPVELPALLFGPGGS